MTPTCNVTSYTAYYNADPINYNDKEVKITLKLEKAAVYLNGDATIITKIDNISTQETQSNRTYTRDYNSSGYTIIPFVYCDTIAGTGTKVVNDWIGTKLTYFGVGVTNGNTFIDGGTYTVTVSVEDDNFTFCGTDENKPNTFTVKINSVYVEYVLVLDYKYKSWGITQKKQITETNKTTQLLNIDDVLSIDLSSSEILDDLYETAKTAARDDNSSYEEVESTRKMTVIIAENTSLNHQATIKSGVTLLVPYDSTYDTTEMPTTTTSTALSVYKKLTINSMLSVDGVLNVSGKQYAKGSPTRTTGSYGLIEMANGSNITVNKGGKLISFGFIKNRSINSDDVGSITLSEGAIAYEPLRIDDWCGGQIANAVKDKFFPFSQFYIGNIESQLDIHVRASLNAHIALYISEKTFTTTIEMFGANGLFGIESGYVTKKVESEKIIITINTDTTINTNDITAEVSSYSMSTNGKEVPICGYYSIIIEGNANIKNRFKLLPGASVTIAETGYCNIETNGALIGVNNSDGSDYKYNFLIYNYDNSSCTYPKGTSVYASDSPVTICVNGKLDVNGTLTGNISTQVKDSTLKISKDSKLKASIVLSCDIKVTKIITTFYSLDKLTQNEFVALTNGEQIVNDSNNTVTYIGNGSYFVKT